MQDPSTTLVDSDPAATSTSQEITTFIDDSAIQEASVPELTNPQGSVIAPASESRNHTIEDILSRPVKITQQSWTTSQLQDTDIYSVAFPDAIVNASELIKDKLQNFTYLRADVCVRVIVNASTFQQGKLLAYFAPFSRVVGNRATLNEFLSAKTTFPHLVLDAATGNSGVLRIPFVSPYTHYNLTTVQGDMGSFRITVLNQLQTLTNCDVTVFAWFENIDLGVPTARANFTPLFSSSSLSQKERDMIKLLVDRKYIRVRKNKINELSTLTGGYISEIAEDVEKSSKGLVTATLEHLGGFAAGAKELPIIGGVFKPVQWIANAASRVSAALGFCKPTSLVTQTKFQNVPAFGYTHTDGLDQSTTLGCFQDNQIQQRGDLFGSKVDEMSLSFICSHSNWIHTFAWPAAATATTNLLEFAVHPGLSSISDLLIRPTILGFASAPFNYWRGGLTYKIQVAKTAYHSGRIRIAFVPSGVLAQPYNLDTCYSWVLDLRTSDQIEFTIPYISNTQYKSVLLAPVDGVPNTDSSTGVLKIEVLNSLRAPDTVAQTVDVNIWIKGADDYQLAIPDFNRYRVRQPDPIPEEEPVVEAEVLSEVSLPLKEGSLRINRPKRSVMRDEFDAYDDYSSGYESQVLGNFQDQGFNDFTPAAEMFKMSSAPDLVPKTLCIGEDITNVRQLIKRFGRRDDVSISQRFASTSVSTGYFGEPATLTTSPEFCPLDYYSWIYRFYRGGVRHKFFVDRIYLLSDTKTGADPPVYSNTSLVLDNATLQSYVEYNASSLPGSPTFSQGNVPPGSAARAVSNGNFTSTQFVDLNPILEVNVPYYANTHILPVNGSGAVALDDIKYNNVGSLYLGNVFERYDGATFDPSTEVRCNIRNYVAASDDFAFGWLVGQPSLISQG